MRRIRSEIVGESSQMKADGTNIGGAGAAKEQQTKHKHDIKFTRLVSS
jgi:hypothetical protein